MPTMGLEPRPDAFDPATPPGPGHPEWELSGKFTCLWSLTGQPVISLPCAFTEAGRPVSMQIIGRLHRDGSLLQVAAACEREWAIAWSCLEPSWVRSQLREGAPRS